MKGCIYLFITKNVHGSWVLVPATAALKEPVLAFPCSVRARPVWAAPEAI